MKKVTRKELEKSFDEYIKINGLKDKALIDQMNQYLSLYDVKEELTRDIEKNGVSYTEPNTAGKSIIKDNKSVDKLLKVNTQMLKILEHLNIKPSELESDDDDEL